MRKSAQSPWGIVALPDRLQPAYQKAPRKKSAGRCRIGAEAFVAGV
jgi:hypothetical protein